MKKLIVLTAIIIVSVCVNCNGQNVECGVDIINKNHQNFCEYFDSLLTNGIIQDTVYLPPLEHGDTTHYFLGSQIDYYRCKNGVYGNYPLSCIVYGLTKEDCIAYLKKYRLLSDWEIEYLGL